MKNKLSDKFTRRDMAFYDLYVVKSFEESQRALKDNQFPLDAGAQEIYEDIEVEDMNELFNDDTLIETNFGETIQVELGLREGQISRLVKEFEEKAAIKGEGLRDSKFNSNVSEVPQAKDPQLSTLDMQLKNLEKEFDRPREEIAQIFVNVSGRLNKMRDYLEGRPVEEWNYLEDLALAKPDDSPEF